MFKNYLIIALRNLWRNQFISLINIVGLTLGLTSCLLILAYTVDELKYDRYHNNSDRLYRVSLEYKWKTGDIHSATTSGPIAPLLKTNFPEVDEITRFYAEGTDYIKTEKEPLEVLPIFTENSFFKVFSYEFIYGDPSDALSKPNTIVLTESTAKKIFGDAVQAGGKLVSYLKGPPQKVTGVIKDPPVRSHFNFDVVGVLDTEADFVKAFQNFSLYTYVLLKKGTSAALLQPKINSLITKESNDPGAQIRLPLQPISSIHLYSHLSNELGANGNISLLYIFVSVAVIILVLACINYMNLATAQSVKRAREVSIRKVLGSARWQLIAQFFTESLLIVLAAAGLSLILIQVVTPLINQIAGTAISIWANGKLFVLGLLGAISIAVGLLSGLYPAIFLSRLKPVLVLKAVFASNPANIFFKRALVVFQFTISTSLMIFTWITYKQITYAFESDLGFNKEEVLGIKVGYDLRTKNLQSFKSQLMQSPAILGTASTTLPLGNDNFSGQGFFLENDGQKPDHTNIGHFLGINADYINLMGIRIVAGRDFSMSLASDSINSVIINEALVRTAGWKEPLGRRIWYFTGESNVTAEATVIGVVKDFHTASLHKAIEPVVMMIAPKQDADNLFIKIKPGTTAISLAFIEKMFRKFEPASPFQYYFLDQNFAKQYQEDERKANLFVLFTSLAIVIACLGLFGLAAFTVEQRKKEIGIRKILGAPAHHLIFLVSKDFLMLVSLAIVISCPIAWWAANRWLQDFVYRVDLSWWMFAGSGLVAMTIAFLTVGLKAFTTANGRPVTNLRIE